MRSRMQEVPCTVTRLVLIQTAHKPGVGGWPDRQAQTPQVRRSRSPVTGQLKTQRSYRVPDAVTLDESDGISALITGYSCWSSFTKYSYLPSYDSI